MRLVEAASSSGSDGCAPALTDLSKLPVSNWAACTRQRPFFVCIGESSPADPARREESRIFSCIGKAVTWRNEVVTQELEGGEEGETRTVMVPRVTIVPTEDLDKATLDAIAEVSQQANGALRVKMHDKHAALVSLGKHLGLFTESVQIKAVYGIRDKPMSAEEWKKQFVKPG